MTLLKTVNCCNIDQKGRIFEMPPAGKMRRVFAFLDECEVCGRPRGIIKNVEFDGSINEVVNRTGAKALELFERYRDQEIGVYKVQGGSRFNMGWYWWDGMIDLWVRDFNGTKIFKLTV